MNGAQVYISKSSTNHWSQLGRCTHNRWSCPYRCHHSCRGWTHTHCCWCRSWCHSSPNHKYSCNYRQKRSISKLLLWYYSSFNGAHSVYVIKKNHYQTSCTISTMTKGLKVVNKGIINVELTNVFLLQCMYNYHNFDATEKRTKTFTLNS